MKVLGAVRRSHRFVARVAGGLVGVLAWSPASGLVCEDPADLAARAPASSDLVIVIDDAAGQVRTPAGRALREALWASGILKDTSNAWRELAQAIDLPPDRAFDELLGRRLMLVIEQGTSPKWALLSDISSDTQVTLRKKLGASPRRFSGVPILSLEHGRFEMAVASGRSPTGRATLMLAPASSGDLFDSMIGVLNGGRAQEPLGRTCGFEHARALEKPSILLFLRREAGCLAVGARPTDRGWDARVVGEPEALGLSRTTRIEAWSSEPFRSLQSDALLAFMGTPSTVATPLRVTRLVSMPAAMESAHDRQFMAIKRLPEDVRGRVGDGSREVLALTMGFENAGIVPDPVGGLASFLEGFGLGRTVLEAVEPGEVRTSPVEGSVRAKLEPLFGASPVVSWAFCGGAGESNRNADSWGWWLLGVAPGRAADRVSGSELTERACQAVSVDHPEGSVRRRLSIGVVRPSAIDEWLSESSPAVDDRSSGLMRRLDRLSWDLWLEEPGRVVGQVEVRMTMPESTPSRP